MLRGPCPCPIFSPPLPLPTPSSAGPPARVLACHWLPGVLVPLHTRHPDCGSGWGLHVAAVSLLLLLHQARRDVDQVFPTGTSRACCLPVSAPSAQGGWERVPTRCSPREPVAGARRGGQRAERKPGTKWERSHQRGLPFRSGACSTGARGSWEPPQLSQRCLSNPVSVPLLHCDIPDPLFPPMRQPPTAAFTTCPELLCGVLLVGP